MTVADPKPAKRVRDKDVFREFHEAKPRCVCCGEGFRVQAHHLLSRAQGGDDVAANLVALCWLCHGALHGQNDRAVTRALARYLRSADGLEARWYLTGKLGVEGSLAFQDRLEA